MKIKVRIEVCENDEYIVDHDIYDTKDFPEAKTEDDLLRLAQEDYCGAKVTVV